MRQPARPDLWEARVWQPPGPARRVGALRRRLAPPPQLIRVFCGQAEVREGQLASGASAWRLGVVAHQVLIAVVFLAGGVVIISALLQFMLSDWAATHTAGVGVRVPIFVAGLLGWIGVVYLVAQRTPVRCSKCGGGAYWRSQKPLRYECQACGTCQ